MTSAQSLSVVISKGEIVDASVIIPTHNRRDWVVRAVNALAKQDYPQDSYEIIVSCDHCTDGTEESLRSTFDERVKVVRSEVSGPSGALNKAFKFATGDLIIILDDELEAEQGFLYAHVQAHKLKAETKIAVVGYSPVKLDSSSTRYARLMARDYEKYFAELGKDARKNTPDSLCGNNFSVSSRAFREVGGYNERYPFQRNDFELAVRLLRLGYEIYFCRAARANQHLAVTANIIIGRTAERAQSDYRLALEYPWCVPYLPFYRVLTSPSVRWRWHVLWEISGPVANLFRAARWACPENLRLANLEYAARYCVGLRQEIGDWQTFCQLADRR